LGLVLRGANVSFENPLFIGNCAIYCSNPDLCF